MGRHGELITSGILYTGRHITRTLYFLLTRRVSVTRVQTNGRVLVSVLFTFIYNGLYFGLRVVIGVVLGNTLVSIYSGGSFLGTKVGDLFGGVLGYKLVGSIRRFL